MSSAQFRVRRATLDALGQLTALWNTMALPAEGLARRITEFQVAESADGRLMGAVALQMAQRLMLRSLSGRFPSGRNTRPGLNHWGMSLLPVWIRIPEQRFLPIHGGFQLFILEAGGEPWLDYRLMRDFWSSNEDARQTYSTHNQGWAQNSGISSAQ